MHAHIADHFSHEAGTSEWAGRELDAKIGSAIRTRRRARGLTMRDLASASGLTIQQIQRSEAGTARITVFALMRLAEALHMTPRTLSRHFAEAAGLSPIRYIQRLRVDVLGEELAANLSVEDGKRSPVEIY